MMRPHRRRIVVLSLLALAVVVTAGVAVWDHRRESPELATRRRMLELRERVGALVERFDDEADGVALLERADGSIFVASREETDDVAVLETARRLLRDAWGRPLVLIVSDTWWLASAGEDGVWTLDSPESRSAYDEEPQRYWVHSPHAPETELEEGDPVVVGDDVVMTAEGRFLGRYPHPPPSAAEVVETVVSRLRRQGDARVVLPERLDEDIRELDPEATRAMLAFLEEEGPKLTLEQDSWSHDCQRKTGGFAPALYLSGVVPAIWVEPLEEGWTLSCSWREFLEAIDEERWGEKIVPVTLRVGGASIQGTSFIFAIERPDAVDALAGQLRAVGADIAGAIEGLSGEHEFGIVRFSAWPGVKAFPRSGRPGAGGPDLTADAQAFLSRLSETPRLSASDGLSAAISMANVSTTPRTVIVYVGTGRGVTDREVAEVAGMNFKRFAIHCLHVTATDDAPPGRDALKRIAESNGGRYSVAETP